MSNSGSACNGQPSLNAVPTHGQPLWLLAELTYKCPLQCPYCANPTNFASKTDELTTAEWVDVFTQARELGAAQLGFSGGEPFALI